MNLDTPHEVSVRERGNFVVRRLAATRSRIAGLVVLAMIVAAPLIAAPSYRLVPVGRPGALALLRRELGEERFLRTLKLNRIDARHAAWIDSLVLAEPGSTLLDLSPFPGTLPMPDSTAKLLVVSLRVQAFAAYEAGRLARWGPISSGAPSSPTPTGVFHVNWRARDHVSSIDSTWIMPWTVNIDTRSGIALHQYALPGMPASHCCIRLMEDDAQWVFDWVDPWILSSNGRVVLARGTPVVVFGSYDHDAPRPWRRLPIHAARTAVSAEEIEAALAPPARAER